MRGLALRSGVGHRACQRAPPPYSFVEHTLPLGIPPAVPCPLARSLITLTLGTMCLEEVVGAAVPDPAAIWVLSSSVVGAAEAAKALACSPEEAVDVALGHLEPGSAAKLLTDHSKGRRNAPIYARLSVTCSRPSTPG